MNSNRNNNRRRGRGNNRGSGGGGGHLANRIDSRARGNAPQLLEKYKKLAHDASLNDDRVQTEYYLQFADHYFRVLADSKAQKDEPRTRRDGERGHSDDRDDEDFDEAEVNEVRQGRSRHEHDDDGDEQVEAAEDSDGDEDDVDNNPFIRDSRRQRPRNRPRRDDRDRDSEGGNTVDPGVLPPSIVRESRDEVGEVQEKPARKRRARPVDDGDGETLEAVS